MQNPLFAPSQMLTQTNAKKQDSKQAHTYVQLHSLNKATRSLRRTRARPAKAVPRTSVQARGFEIS